ncbi:MAG: PilT/PilU family type 4a pilus ATPase [Candidatus Omnitrophica bacterium]|nr:PilT/PilU family type 4a pilus ATPase [Candidatus Omnitrophota bacterium]
MTIKDYLKLMVEKNASDLFFRAQADIRMRIDGKIEVVDERIVSLDEIKNAIKDLTSKELEGVLGGKLDTDFGLYAPELDNRFRLSLFIQRGLPVLVIRNISRRIPTFEELNLPAEVLKKLCMEMRGLILLTGTMGSGKSTTIASMIDYINENSRRHILTIEEPIEFNFQDKKSIIHQRELGRDVVSYPDALRAFTLQSPDVIYIANIRDYETMSAALTAAETGVLVLSTLHTVNAAQTVERIVNFFPPHQHQEMRTQLSYLLKGVISLRLVPAKDKPGRFPAYEVMLLTPTVSRLIREAKTWEIPEFIEDGKIFGMQSFNQSLVSLIRQARISEEQAVDFADNKEEFLLTLRGIRRK